MKKILVSDDDFITIQLIKKKLTEENFDVTIAKNGKIGIELLKKTKFDLIITDIHMPYITGLELISFMREEMSEDTPIIVLTKDISEDTEEDAYSIGADEYLIKPPKPNILMIKIKKILGDSSI